MVNLISKLNPLLPHSSLLTVYKCLIRPLLDYGDAVYDQPNLSCLTNKIKPVQYNVALTITGLIRATFEKKLHQELSFKSLNDGR